MHQNSIVKISKVICDYFSASHFGHIEVLEKIIKPDCLISGFLDGCFVKWTRSDFLERIKKFAKDVDQNSTYNKQIISLDVTHHIAFAKTQVIICDKIFIDHLSLVYKEEQWHISNKVFTDFIK